MPPTMLGASRAAASVRGAGASHSAEMPDSKRRESDDGLVGAAQCRCPGPYSCGSWKSCLGGKTANAPCSQPTTRDYCSQCACSWCDKVRHKSKACYRHQWKLAPTEYKFVKAFGPSLIQMKPPDLSAFVMHGAKQQILRCPAAAVLAAQMWCPVAVRHSCSAVHHQLQAAKTAKGLMNIFLATVRHISDVAKDEKHIDHEELEDIWA